MRRRQNSLIIQLSVKKLTVRKWRKYTRLIWKQSKDNTNNYLKIYKQNIRRRLKPAAITSYRECKRRKRLDH